MKCWHKKVRHPGVVVGRELHDAKLGIARAVRKRDGTREIEWRLGADAGRGELAVRGIGVVGRERDRAEAFAAGEKVA